MTALDATMLALIFSTATLIVWLLAVEAFEALRKKRRTAFERELGELADDVCRRAREKERFRQ